jgi:GTPase
MEYCFVSIVILLSNSHGSAYYELGVKDSGEPIGISSAALDSSIATLVDMALSLDAETSVYIFY